MIQSVLVHQLSSLTKQRNKKKKIRKTKIDDPSIVPSFNILTPDYFSYTFCLDPRIIQ